MVASLSAGLGGASRSERRDVPSGSSAALGGSHEGVLAWNEGRLGVLEKLIRGSPLDGWYCFGGEIHDGDSCGGGETVRKIPSSGINNVRWSASFARPTSDSSG